MIGVKRTTTTTYHPYSNGAFERTHRTLGEYFRYYVDAGQRNWDDYIPYASFTYNSSIHGSTEKQPYELHYESYILFFQYCNKASIATVYL